MIVALWLACAAPPPLADSCPADAPVDALLVMRQITFTRPEGTTSRGFDLDGHTTAAGDPVGCGVPDYVGADGRPGVDNAFARILPALELTEAQAVEEIIADTIRSGELMLTVALSDLDGPDDPCVGVEVGQASGAPMLGTDGEILPGQTYDPDPAVAPVRVDEAGVVGGVLEVSGLDLTLPLTVFGVDFEVALPGAALRVELDDEGGAVGTFAGPAEAAYLSSVARAQNVDPAVADVLDALLAANSDLGPGADGVCTQVSATWDFEAVSGFWFDPNAP